MSDFLQPQQRDQKVCLIPELCFLTGLTEDLTSDRKIMTDVANYTRLTPESRNRALIEFVRKVKGFISAKRFQLFLTDFLFIL